MANGTSVPAGNANVNAASTTGAIGTPADELGYIRYNSADSYSIDPELYTEANLFAEAYPNSTGGCNISFDAFFDIDFNLPDFSFDLNFSDFDTSFFDKTDALSLEFTMINEMLINAIQSMGCCDIAKVYNVTMVPFFQFFADSNNGGFMEILVGYAEIITALRAIIEPLECLIRFVPGNPWWPFEIDPLAWIYGYFKEAKPFLDRILSGEVLDIMLNPVHNMRQKLQGCLSSGIPQDANTGSFYEVGSAEQLLRISKIAAQSGNPITEASLPHKAEPKKPRPQDFLLGENDPKYISDLEDYKINKADYDGYLKYRGQLEAEAKREQSVLLETNRSLAVTAQTNVVIHASTDGLCGCVADALGINNSSVKFSAVRTTQDLYSMVGQSPSGVTNKAAGVTSKNRPKDEPYTIAPDDIKKTSAVKAIVGAGAPKGQSFKLSIGVGGRTVNNPYASIGVAPNTVIEIETIKAEKEAGPGDTYGILKQNDMNKKIIDDLTKQSETLGQSLQKTSSGHRTEWLAAKAKAQQLLSQAISNSSGATTDRTQALKLKKEKIELEVANSIFSSYFDTFRPLDLTNDPNDTRVIGSYLFEEEYLGLYPSNYWDSVQTYQAERYKDAPELLNVPFAPETPPEKIISSLNTSSSVDIDARHEIFYFNSGFIKEKGSLSWRTFNKLCIPWDEAPAGAIAKDKSVLPFVAVYPSDDVGDNACLEYVRSYPQGKELNVLYEQELKAEGSETVDIFATRIEEKYGFSRDTYMGEISDNDMFIIIDEISLANGYRAGKMWIKTKPVQPGTKITSIGDRRNYADRPTVKGEYVYNIDAQGTRSIKFNDREINTAELTEVFNTNNTADKIRQIVNDSIAQRANYYQESVTYEWKRQAVAQGVDLGQNIVINSIASVVPADFDLHIPCTCENFLCAILNTIIQYVLGALNRLLQELVDMIIKFLIPDWLKDILRLLFDMLNCLFSVFGTIYTISEIDRYAKELLESMRDRIRYYPADACFVPGATPPPVAPDSPADDYPGDIPGLDNDDNGFTSNDTGDTYIPGITNPDDGVGTNPGGENNDTGGDDNGRCYNPPMIASNDVKMVPGDSGRCIPGFEFNCNYLKL